MIQVETEARNGTNLTTGVFFLLVYHDMSNIHFIGCSNQTDCIQISASIVGDLLLLEKRGIVAYAAFIKIQVQVFAPVIMFIGDNPRASEVLNH